MHIHPLFLASAVVLSALPVAAQDFPRSFEHKFGTTVIEEKPERVVTLTYPGVDHYLALGVVPVGTRYWWGDYPFGIWPWAQDALGDADLLALTEVNYEQIAALDPDVIEAVVSGISAEDYAELSKIAPVVATSPDQSDWSTPWYETLRTAGLITGESEKAEAIIAALQDRIEEIAADHPQWQSMTASVATIDEGEIGVFLDKDIRAQLLSQLGFTIVPGLDDVETNDETYATISQERLSMIEADVVIWVTWDGDVEPIKSLALRDRSSFRQEGREVFADAVLSGAFSWSSPLSLNFLLDALVPAIDQAVDGNPNTPVELTVAAGLTD